MTYGDYPDEKVIIEKHARFLCHQINKLRYTKEEISQTPIEYVDGYTEALNTCISVIIKNS